MRLFCIADLIEFVQQKKLEVIITGDP